MNQHISWTSMINEKQAKGFEDGDLGMQQAKLIQSPGQSNLSLHKLDIQINLTYQPEALKSISSHDQDCNTLRMASVRIALSCMVSGALDINSDNTGSGFSENIIDSGERDERGNQKE